MVKRKVANPLAFAVLGSLGERSMHPYEISTMLKARGKDGSIKLNYGSLYSVVAALEKAGFIEAVETVREGNRPERTVYAITEAGRAEFSDWLTELLGSPEKEYSQLEAGLAYVPAFPPDRVVELLEQRVVGLDAADRGVDRGARVHAVQGVPPDLLDRVGVPGRAAHRRAELRAAAGRRDPRRRPGGQRVLAQDARARRRAGDQRPATC